MHDGAVPRMIRSYFFILIVRLDRNSNEVS